MAAVAAGPDRVTVDGESSSQADRGQREAASRATKGRRCCQHRLPAPGVALAMAKVACDTKTLMIVPKRRGATGQPVPPISPCICPLVPLLGSGSRPARWAGAGEGASRTSPRPGATPSARSRSPSKGNREGAANSSEAYCLVQQSSLFPSTMDPYAAKPDAVFVFFAGSMAPPGSSPIAISRSQNSIPLARPDFLTEGSSLGAMGGAGEACSATLRYADDSLTRQRMRPSAPEYATTYKLQPDVSWRLQGRAPRRCCRGPGLHCAGTARIRKQERSSRAWSHALRSLTQRSCLHAIQAGPVQDIYIRGSRATRQLMLRVVSKGLGSRPQLQRCKRSGRPLGRSNGPPRVRQGFTWIAQHGSGTMDARAGRSRIPLLVRPNPVTAGACLPGWSMD